MSKYFKDFDTEQEKQYVKSIDDIKTRYEDNSYDEFDCGQGYYQNEWKTYARFQGQFYTVVVTAEIGSSWQDRGDYLYFVESIEDVTLLPITANELEEDITKDLRASLRRHESEVNTIIEELTLVSSEIYS